MTTHELNGLIGNVVRYGKHNQCTTLISVSENGKSVVIRDIDGERRVKSSLINCAYVPPTFNNIMTDEDAGLAAAPAPKNGDIAFSMISGDGNGGVYVWHDGDIVRRTPAPEPAPENTVYTDAELIEILAKSFDVENWFYPTNGNDKNLFSIADQLHQSGILERTTEPGKHGTQKIFFRVKPAFTGETISLTLHKEWFQYGKIIAENETQILAYFYFAGQMRDYNFCVIADKRDVTKHKTANTKFSIWRDAKTPLQMFTFYNVGQQTPAAVIERSSFKTNAI